jgi:hypothetical protein
MHVRDLPNHATGTLTSDWISTLGKTATAEEAHGRSTGPGRPNRLPRPREHVGELMAPVGLATDGSTMWVADGKMGFARIVAFRLADGTPLCQLGGSVEKASEIDSTPWLGDDGEPVKNCRGLVLVDDVLVVCVGTHLVALSTQMGQPGEITPLFPSPPLPIVPELQVTPQLFSITEAGGLAAHGNTIFVADDGGTCVHVLTLNVEARSFTHVREIGPIDTIRGVAADATHLYVSAWTFEESAEDGSLDDDIPRLEVWTHAGELQQSLTLHLDVSEAEVVDLGIGMAVAAGHLYVPVTTRLKARGRRHVTKLMVYSLWGGALATPLETSG